MSKNVITGRYDLGGNTLPRLLKLFFLGRFVPLGNWRGGPGLRCLVALSVLHYAGGLAYFLSARYNLPLAQIKRIIKK